MARHHVAWMQPRAGFVQALWEPRKAVVSDGLEAFLSTLRAFGCPFAVCKTDANATAWIDDQRCICRGCGGGTGEHVCQQCQQEALVGGLLLSVKRAS